ncbi:MAG: SPOR domain-containing protein [Candidatus Binatia bacterium]
MILIVQNLWLALLVAAALLLTEGCTLQVDDASRKLSPFGLIATPPSHYSTPKGRYLGERYKENLNRLVAKIIQNPKTASLQFANNIASVGGIGFYTHSAVKVPDERFLEVVLGATETFKTKGEYSAKVARLFALYGKELLQILSSDVEIYSDKEFAGYGLNFTWRTVTPDAAGSRVGTERAIAYFPKEKVKAFLKQDLSENTLLEVAVIFAVEEDGPINLVSFSALEQKPDFRPPIQEEVLPTNPGNSKQEFKPITPAVEAPTAPEVKKPAPSTKKEPAAKKTEEPVAMLPELGRKSSTDSNFISPKSIQASRPVPPAPKVAELVKAEIATEEKSVNAVVDEKPQPLRSDMAKTPALKPERVPLPSTIIAEPAQTLHPAPPAPKVAELVKAEIAAEEKSVSAVVVEKSQPLRSDMAKTPALKPERVPLPSTIIAEPAQTLHPAPPAPKVAELVKAEIAAEEKSVSAVVVEKPQPVKSHIAKRRTAELDGVTSPSVIAKPAEPSPKARRPVQPQSDAKAIDPVTQPEVTQETSLNSSTILEQVGQTEKFASKPDLPTPQLPMPMPSPMGEEQKTELKKENTSAAPADKMMPSSPKQSQTQSVAEKPFEIVSAFPKMQSNPATIDLPAPALLTQPNPPEDPGRAVEEKLALIRKKPAEKPLDTKPLLRPVPRSLEGYIIQVAFVDRTEARHWANTFERRGYAVSVTEGAGSLRVRIGNFRIRDDADRQLRNLKQDGLTGIILNLPQAYRPEARSSLP